jgi:DNA-binding transcriptional MerR regulator
MSDRDKQAPAPAPGLKMRALVAATGVAKSTILHYLNKGLLPEPRKTSPNMAYYDPACIDRIRYIRHLQRRHRLSLSEIKQTLTAKGQDLDMTLYNQLDTLIFGRPAEELPLDTPQFCGATGLTEDQVANLLNAKLLLPVSENHFDPQDVGMGKMYAEVSRYGLRGEDMREYVELCEKIVDHEMAVRKRLTHHLPYDKDAALTIELVKSARMMRAYIIDRLFQHRVAEMRNLKDIEGKK